MPADRRARVPFITDRGEVPADARHHYDSIAESRGDVIGPFCVLLNSPEIAGRVGHLGEYVRFESDLPGAVRELAIITTAREHDCAFEWAIHEPLAREEGVSDETIAAVANRESVSGLPEKARTVVAYARELVREHEVSDATFECASDEFGDRGVTELTVTMGYYSMIACVLNALEVFPEDDAPDLP